MNKKIEAVDFLKGYSILTIVIFHLGQVMNLSALLARMINFGGTGVHTFIFVSGFGLYLSHLKKPLPFVEFLKKRFTKIYLPYIIVVALSAIISFFIPVYDNSLYAFLGHLFIYKMFDENIIGSYGYQLWFISTIIQFYLIFPLLVILKSRLNTISFLALGVIISICWSILVLLIHKGEVRVWISFFPQYLWEFMLGMICAEKFVKKGFEFWSQPKIILLVTSLAGIGMYGFMALKLGVWGKDLNDIPALFGYTAFSLLIYSFNIQFINKFILFTAKISYPLFLIHFLILRIMDVSTKYYGISFSWMIAALTLILCYLSSILLDNFFKKIGV